jgi:hypothetical protein
MLVRPTEASGRAPTAAERGLPKSDFQNSLAIGALAIDPNNNLRVFAGTGQYGEAVGTLYGNGILYSSNGGDSWTELATSTFQRDEISKILFDPTDATSQNMFLSARQGVFESTDGGVNWSLLRAGDASDLVLITSGPGVQLIAGFAGSGIFTATRTGMGWSAWTQFVSADFPTTFQRIVLGQCRDHPNRIYAAFSDGTNVAGIAKTQNGGNSWNRVIPPLSTDINTQSTTSGAPAHVHNITLTAAAMAANTLVYTSGPASAGPAHTHTITLTAQQLSDLRDGLATVVVTSSSASGHTHVFVLNRRLSGQTWYNFHISPHPTNSHANKHCSWPMRSIQSGSLINLQPLLYYQGRSGSTRPNYRAAHRTLLRCYTKFLSVGVSKSLTRAERAIPGKRFGDLPGSPFGMGWAVTLKWMA